MAKDASFESCNGAGMRAVSAGKRWVVAVGLLLLAMTTMHVGAQAAEAHNGDRVQQQATAEDVLAALVHHSAVIFAGQVYAIRVPTEMSGASGVKGGLPSSRPDAVEVEFRVDMGIRGTSIGSNYVLRVPASAWQQTPPFTLHQRAVAFLKPLDAAGFSGPVEGESDIPGMDLGVMSIDASNQVDLSRLERLVSRKMITSATMLPQANSSSAVSVTDVNTGPGEDTLISGSSEGKMPELRNKTVPFLALVRDVSVLVAAEDQQLKAAPGAPTN
jgi:hypothetical protein